MKKSFLGATLILALLSGTAHAERAYVTVKGEYDFSSNSDLDLTAGSTGISGSADSGDGYGGAVALGAHLFDNFRWELEASYRKLQFDDVSPSGSAGELEAYTGMGNLYMDFKNTSAFTPYIGAGAGIARDKDTEENTFAYQGMAGLDVRLDDSLSLVAGYKYFRTNDFEKNETLPLIGNVKNEYNLESHIVEGGFKFNF